MEPTETNPQVEVVRVSIWSWVRWTLFPFVSLKRHTDALDAYDAALDESTTVNEMLAGQVAELLDQVDSLEMQLADKGFEPSGHNVVEPPLDNWTVTVTEVDNAGKPARVILDHDDEALARMDTDGYIDPAIWGHPVKD